MATTALIICVTTMITTVLIIHTLTIRTRDRIDARAHAERAEQRARECHHVWNNWTVVKYGPLVTSKDAIPHGHYTHQKRICDICKEIELKTVTTKTT